MTIMKKLFLLIIFAVAALFVSAQTTGKQSSKNSKAVSHATTRKTINTKNTMPPVKLSNRKNYMFKNGQESTPTGYQAAGTNGDEFVSGRKKAPAKNVKHS